MINASKAYGNEWTPEVIDYYYRHLEQIAVNEWGYKIYPNQLEIVNSAGMLEAYASHGMPIFYPHWSFGKAYLGNEKSYKRGHMGLAYEMIINSDPCISYLMEENTLTMQVLVTAHAAFGHNHFFKNNFMFKQWTMADYIIDYLRFAKHYIEKCEERYGPEAVEEVIDAAHALRYYAVDKYKRPKKRKGDEEIARLKRVQWDQAQYDHLTMKEFVDPRAEAAEDDPLDVEPTENILYFLEKYSPVLTDWEREIIRIVRKIGQYLYPQGHTKVANEGFATYSHCKLIEELDKRKLVDEAFMLEFCHMHSGVVFQPGLKPLRNPYALGLAIFRDIERMATTPTSEDHEWFPTIAGKKDYWPIIFNAVENYKDESFILQFMSPKVIRDFRMFALLDDGDNPESLEVSAIHNDAGYRKIREICSREHDWNILLPRIEVFDVNWKQDRRLILRHHMYRNRPLDKEVSERVLAQVYRLWGFPVEVHSIDDRGIQKAKSLHKPFEH